MIEFIKFIKSVGQFEEDSSGSDLSLRKLTLIYAENGRGKTTLASIFRSLSNGNPTPILERRRLGSTDEPHVVITGNNPKEEIVFENGAWRHSLPNISIYDDDFITANICSGIEVGPEHRRNLHGFIIGAEGISLSKELQKHVDRIGGHNSLIKEKGEAISSVKLGNLSVNEFCGLEKLNEIERLIEEKEREIDAAKQSAQIQKESDFDIPKLPQFDLKSIQYVLGLELRDLGQEAEKRVKAHFSKLEEGGEAWVSAGMAKIEKIFSDKDQKICPFCAQDLKGSTIISHYQAYFSAEYKNLQESILGEIQKVNSDYGNEAISKFQNSVERLKLPERFWGQFCDVPEIMLATSEITEAWNKVFQEILVPLQAKKLSPLEKLELNESVNESVTKYNELKGEVKILNQKLLDANEKISQVKLKAGQANLRGLESELNHLKNSEIRYRPEIADLCREYIEENKNKRNTEVLRGKARDQLKEYQECIFPKYEKAINKYLKQFTAGFRLKNIQHTNTGSGSGSSCKYNILINDTSVDPDSKEGKPSFRNTLSTGDRNTLALAFFFASLEHEPNPQQRIVVIDDPKGSLDEHRSHETITKIRNLTKGVDQVIVLSHSKPFLYDLWESCSTDRRFALKIERKENGSTLVEWSVDKDCIDEHDRRHEFVMSYIKSPVEVDKDKVATHLRLLLERFLRVSYPNHFPAGFQLGQFLGKCSNRLSSGEKILSQENLDKLDQLCDYAHRFHHATNPEYQSAINNINDQELLGFSQRTLEFLQKG